MLKIRLIVVAVTVAFLSSGCTPIASNVRPDVDHEPESIVENQVEETANEQPTEAERKQSGSASSEEWGYGDNNGPTEWGDINPDYHLCKNGKRQSPIDISSTQKARLSNIVFNYKSGPKEIINTGHSIQVNMWRGSHITVSGKSFSLQQIHFHAPSEHTIDGKPSDMAAHFVHKARDGQIAVVAVMMEGCLESKTVRQLWKKMPSRAGGKKKFSKKMAKWIKVAKLIPKGRGYYTYRGSLTTPPCTEDVLWLVMKNATPISKGQVKTFTDLYPNNARPVQDTNYRVVKSK